MEKKTKAREAVEALRLSAAERVIDAARAALKIWGPHNAGWLSELEAALADYEKAYVTNQEVEGCRCCERKCSGGPACWDQPHNVAYSIRSREQVRKERK